MKNKYQRLSKEERKEARDRFKKVEDNKLLYTRLIRLEIICIIGIIFGIGVVVYTLITNDKWLFIAEYGFMIVFCVSMIAFANGVLNKKYNEFLINENKQEKKDDKGKKKNK